MSSLLTTDNLLTVTATKQVNGRMFYDQEQYNYTEVIEGDFECCSKKRYYRIVIDGVNYDLEEEDTVLTSEITGTQGQFHYHRAIDKFDTADPPLNQIWRPNPAKILEAANNCPI